MVPSVQAVFSSVDNKMLLKKKKKKVSVIILNLHILSLTLKKGHFSPGQSNGKRQDSLSKDLKCAWVNKAYLFSA